jgi:hypothetical protein
MYFIVKLEQTPPHPLLYKINKEMMLWRISFSITYPRTLNLGTRFFYGGKDVTPLVLLELKLGHGIICIGISLCMLHLECIH